MGVLTGYIFFTVYFLTNIITGIFCDTAIQSAQGSREEAIQSQMDAEASTFMRIKEHLEEADEDKDGYITLEELENHLKSDKVRAHLSSLGLELHEVRGLFRLLDLDHNKAVPVEDFTLGSMRLKGPARSIDLALLRYENHKMYKNLKEAFRSALGSQRNAS